MGMGFVLNHFGEQARAALSTRELLHLLADLSRTGDVTSVRCLFAFSGDFERYRDISATEPQSLKL
jgi:hypothetical protein